MSISQPLTFKKNQVATYVGGLLGSYSPTSYILPHYNVFMFNFVLFVCLIMIDSFLMKASLEYLHEPSLPPP